MSLISGKSLSLCPCFSFQHLLLLSTYVDRVPNHLQSIIVLSNMPQCLAQWVSIGCNIKYRILKLKVISGSALTPRISLLFLVILQQNVPTLFPSTSLYSLLHAENPQTEETDWLRKEMMKVTQHKMLQNAQKTEKHKTTHEKNVMGAPYNNGRLENIQTRT